MIVRIVARLAEYPARSIGLFEKNRWYYEVEAEECPHTPPCTGPGPEVVHSDGFYPSAEIAIREGDEWAISQGYTVHVT